MLRSTRPHNPDKPQGGKHGPPPNPDDRYAPRGCVWVGLVDMDGQPIDVCLTPRVARMLIEDLRRELTRLGESAGGK